MLKYPEINPIAFSIASWPVHWYGLMYLLGFVTGWWLLAQRLKSQNFWQLSQDQLSDIIFYAALGVVLGGRIGYVFFYAWPSLVENPWFLLQTWKGGMSFHGGLIGVIIALTLYSRKLHRPILFLTDFIAPIVPIGLGAGRIGNFINGELWGRVTNLPWGMVFPSAGDFPRHPSQLYEFFLEGVVLFAILWIFSRKQRPLGAISGCFALFYGLFRIIAECFREPDVQIGYIANYFTEGQLLSLPLVVIGLALIYNAYRRGNSCNNI